ncbi:MAG: acyl-CoA synthetase [Janthinobacterium lividum]
MSQAIVSGWMRPERGGSSLCRLMLWVTLRFGWPVGQALLPLITAYFLATGSDARAASRTYLGRVLGRRPNLIDVARHFHSFASTTLDRVFLLSDRSDRYRITIEGEEVLARALALGRGCILLGAHVGSFEVLRSIGRHSPMTVKVLMFRGNAGAATYLLEQLDPEFLNSVIEIGTPHAMLQVSESLARGELVGMLGDRAPHGEKTIPVEFLGAPALLPAGPLLVAAMLHAPVVLFHGVRTGPRRYLVGFEPFADEIVLPRGRRDAALQGWIQLYAGRIEALCRAYPFSWFNFHDVWASGPTSTRP